MAFAIKLIGVTNDLLFDGFWQKVLVGHGKTTLSDDLARESCSCVALADARKGFIERSVFFLQ